MHACTQAYACERMVDVDVDVCVCVRACALI